MPKLTQYDQQVLPQGQLSVQASPDDFGAAVGRGIQNVGQGMDNLNDAQRAVATDKSKVWAIKSASDARLQWLQEMQSAQTDPDFAKKYGADGAAFADTMKSKFEDFANEALANAPDKQSSFFLQEQMRSVGEDLMKDAIGFQAKTSASWATTNLVQTGEQNGRSAFIAPQHFQSIIADQDAQIDAIPYLTPEQRQAAKDKGREDVAFAAGKGIVQASPESVLATLRPEELDKFRPTSRIVKVMNSNLAVALPRNLGGNVVSPYKADKIAEVAQLTAAPSRFDNLFQMAAQTWGVDVKELKMRAAAESHLDPKAVSGQGAKGIMQITDDTARGLGITDVFDPWQSINGAAKLLAKLQGKAAGDTTAIDKMYYGGEGGTNWGANTAQYAENLAAVRATMNGGGDAPASFQDVLDNVLADKEPVRSAQAPDWFNQLPWDKQYTIIQEAKEGTRANQTQEFQQIAFKKQQMELLNKQAMTEGIDKAVDRKLSVADIRGDTRLDFEGKKALLEALSADLLGKGKTNYDVFYDTLNRIHAPAGSPNRITDEGQLLSLVGKGLSFEDVKKLRDEMQGKGTAEGDAVADLKKGFIDAAKSNITKTTLTSRDGPGDAKFYMFQQALSQVWDAKIKAGVSPMEMLNPQSKEYLGYLVPQFARTGQQAMKDKAQEMRAAPGFFMTPGAGKTPPARIPGETVEQYLERVK